MTATTANPCEDRTYCGVCRTQDSVGENFRLVYFGKKNADCPAGLPWLPAAARAAPATETAENANKFHDIKNMAPVANAPDSLACRRIKAHCQTCENYQNRRCLLYHGGRCSPCEFRAYLNRLGAVCPVEDKSL